MLRMNKMRANFAKLNSGEVGVPPSFHVPPRLGPWPVSASVPQALLLMTLAFDSCGLDSSLTRAVMTLSAVPEPAVINTRVILRRDWSVLQATASAAMELGSTRRG